MFTPLDQFLLISRVTRAAVHWRHIARKHRRARNARALGPRHSSADANLMSAAAAQTRIATSVAAAPPLHPPSPTPNNDAADVEAEVGNIADE